MVLGHTQTQSSPPFTNVKMQFHGIADVCAVFVTSGFIIDGEAVPREIVWWGIHETAKPRLVYVDIESEYAIEEEIKNQSDIYYKRNTHGLEYKLLDHEKKRRVPILKPSNSEYFIENLYNPTPTKYLVGYLKTSADRDMLEKAGLPAVDPTKLGTDSIDESQLSWDTPTDVCESHTSTNSDTVCAAYVVNAVRNSVMYTLLNN